MSTEIQKISAQEPRPRHEEVERGSGADPQTDRHGGQRRVPQEWDRRDRAERPDECRRPDPRRVLQALRVEGPARRRGVCRGRGDGDLERLAAAASEGRGAAAAYLSTGHRDNPATGCPLSAIGSELARSDEKTRAAATAGFLKLVEIMAGQFGKIPPATARRRALVAVSTMIGALTMSRIVTDPELSAEILKEAEKSLADG